jgi:hypothetical protein
VAFYNYDVMRGVSEREAWFGNFRGEKLFLFWRAFGRRRPRSAGPPLGAHLVHQGAHDAPDRRHLLLPRRKRYKLKFESKGFETSFSLDGLKG